MANLTRTGTDYLGNSVPGLDVRPNHDYITLDNLLMDVPVQAGQPVHKKVNGHGELATTTTGHYGISLETKPAGQKVAVLFAGKMAGFSTVQNPGTPVWLSATAGEVADAGTVKIGLYVGGNVVLFFGGPSQAT